MDVTIITVNYNGKAHILDQIQSVKDNTSGISLEQIISDNGSTDGSLQEIKKRFPDVQVIENGTNLGFGAANNKALDRAKGEFLLLLNPDMTVPKGTIATLVEYMRKHEDVGIVSPKLVDEQGNVNPKTTPRRFPQLRDQVFLLLKLQHLFPNVLDHYLFRDVDAEKEQNVDSVQGSFMLIRKNIANELGWIFDPRYFIWFEDVDLCREVHKRGYKVMYLPSVSATDFAGQTFKTQPSVQKQRWFTKSMIFYFDKWHSRADAMLLRALRPVALLLVWVHSKVTH